jgi:SlyX protein
MTVESRVTELEVKLAYAEDMIDSLNKTVFRQQEQIELLQAQLSLLHRQLQESVDDGRPREPREEIPPHY